jgi:2-polyprenyl-3-methyl-5-hydroxy-6-metoxy-1,4-benzoquinol methylase
MSLQCIFCDSTDIIVSDSINTSELSRLYKKRANINVERFFKEETIDLCSCSGCGLKFYQPQVAGDGKFYDELQLYKGYYLEEKPEFFEAAKYITSDKDVLEIGCGEGLFSNYISYKSYTGLEFSEVAIQKASSRGLTVLNQPLEQHAGTHEAGYDVVCYFQVLEHVIQPRKFIKDSIKCLKKDGILILAVPSEDSFIKQAINFYLNMPPHHISRWPDNTLSKIAAMNDLELVTLYHEKLHAVHKRFYYTTIINTKLRKLCGLTFKPLDNSIAGNIVYGIAVCFSVIVNLFPGNDSKTGQSVMAVYKKK